MLSLLSSRCGRLVSTHLFSPRRGLCALERVAGAAATRDVEPPAMPPVLDTGGSGCARSAFEAVWSRLEATRAPLIFPREIIWLNGAPGSGKTRNSRFMMETRGFGHAPIVMSDVLATVSGSAQAAIDTGQLVDDEVVLECLFDMLLQPQHRSGALVDGFPRTSAQVECLPLLRDKLRQLRARDIAARASQPVAASTASAPPASVPYPVPRFFVCILYVGKEESVRRQLLRGEQAVRHNARVRETGTGVLIRERKTDFDRALIEKRYAIFEQHRGTLLALRQHFPFSVIDAERPIEGVERQILKQFRYQSNQELRASTFCAIDRVPLANKLRFNARDALVTRLDEYDELYRDDFAAAVEFVKMRVVPACRRAAFNGSVSVRIVPEDEMYSEFARVGFSQMVIDVLAERGYGAEYVPEEQFVPVKFSVDSGKVECERRITHVVKVAFPRARLTGSVSEGNTQLNMEVVTRG